MVRAPGNVMFDGMSRQMRERRVRGVLEDRQRLRVFDVGVRIDEAEQQFVVGIGGEAVFDVEVGRDGLRVEAIEAQHLLAGLVVAGDGVGAGQRRYPLAEGAGGGKAVVEILAVVVVGIVVIPAAQIFAGRGHAGHLAKRLQQAVIAERHEHGVSGHELRLVQIAGHQDIAVAELRQQGRAEVSAAQAGQHSATGEGCWWRLRRMQANPTEEIICGKFPSFFLTPSFVD